ncbi:MAG: putative transport system permease protein, partial [Acidimicrobiia bacterium]|nr:putative transport system permease protein [Acidimicrobiia bacterium]
MRVGVSQPRAGVDATAAHGGRPARRAMVRWAWRLFRREWRQQVLVLALLSLTVAATTLGAAIAANTLSQVDARMGTANQRLSLSGSASNVTAAVEAARQWFGTIEVIAHQNIVIPGSISTLDLRDADPAGVYGAPLLRVTVGHFPTTSDEVALTRGAAATLEAGIGDAWQHNGRQFRVVGLVENPRDLLDDFVLVAPGQAHPPDQVRILVDAPAAKVRSFHAGDVPVLIEARSDLGKTAAATVVLALGTAGLLFVGLVAIAGF